MEQIPWTTYFERELFLKPSPPQANGADGAGRQAEDVTYHAYLTSPVGQGPLFVMHHGAGSSGLSFAVVSSEIRKRLPSAGILAIDARGHGSTTVTRSSPGSAAADTTPELDLSLSTLSADLYAAVLATKAQMSWPELPPIVLVGHSLGGAVVTELARTGDLGAALLGYAVLDVVEGSAMDALQSMQSYLSSRPAGFASVRDAIEWHVRSRTIRNAVSARTSVPALLVDSEEEASGDGEGAPRGGRKARPWVWKTDLSATQPFWEGWFVGLSKKFLEARGGKMLLLAGTDRLDTELTIGQMQGMWDHDKQVRFMAGGMLTIPLRKICAASVSRGRALHPRRPT